ncbi:hypothetical protein THRCLA_21011 [Thraustotheca clavata]|uniref:FYVE-type domain-containing protein n=1 Tax=Thraustotheca clavata TaxID=74557 RepID=A0A1W0A198_9STRA|nr:hypothetical protein THRCLA_21011 [Thraustotheca clavata]
MEVLDEYLVPTVLVSSTEASIWRERISALSSQALQTNFKHQVIADRTWIWEDDKMGIKVYSKPMENTPFNQYVCIGTLRTSLRTIVDGLYADTTPDQKVVDSILYENEFVNAGILQCLEKCTLEDPMHFVGLKYLKHSITLSSSPRDFVCLEHSGITKGANNEPIVFIARESMNLSSLPEAKGTVRGSMSSALIFRKIEHGQVEVTARWFIDPNGASFVNHQGASKLRQMILRLPTLAQFRRIVSTPLSTSWVPDAERKACLICAKRFNALRSKHHCRVCGEIICAACTIKVIYVPPCSTQKVTGKYCGNCIDKAKTPADKFNMRKQSHTNSVASTLDFDDTASESSSHSLKSHRSAKTMRQNASRSNDSTDSSLFCFQGLKEAHPVPSTGFIKSDFKDIQDKKNSGAVDV